MTHSGWYREIASRIGAVCQTLDNTAARQLRVALLKNAAARVAEFSAAPCRECGSLLEDVEQLVSDLEQLTQSGEIDRRQYFTRLRRIINHLKSKHGLSEKGSYLSQWIALGLCFGMVFYNMLGPAYIGLGLCLGIAVGSALDADAKKKGKQI